MIGFSSRKYWSSLFVLVLVASVGSSYSWGQVTSSSSSNGSLTSGVLRAQATVNEVLLKAGISFKEGLSAYEDNRRSDAGEKFNKSIETFLYSTLNIQGQPKLQNCYNQLIETIYRIEFPVDNQLPQIRNLSLTCSWTNIDAAQAEKIATLVRNSMIAQPVIGPPSRNAVAKEPPNPAALLQRFHTQEFEPSPLDELSKLELTAEEVEMDSDPYSMRIVRWSEVTRIVVNGEPYWRISIRYRAKNRMSAYVLSEQVFYIRHNKIMSTFEID